MALKGMERTTLGITAGLAILAAAIQYLHPHFRDTSAMACPFVVPAAHQGPSTAL